MYILIFTFFSTKLEDKISCTEWQHAFTDFSSTPRPLFTPAKDPVSILQEAEWAPGPVWTGGKSRLHRDSIPDRPARSQSLYLLSYPAHANMLIRTLNSGKILSTNNINSLLDATIINFIDKYNQLNMFRAIIRPSSGALDCVYSLWYNAPAMLQAASPVYCTTSCEHSLALLRMGELSPETG